jgi:hypothetical protein
MTRIPDDASRLHFEAHLIRMTSPGVLPRLFRKYLLEGKDGLALFVVREMARRIGIASAQWRSTPAGPQDALSPFAHGSPPGESPVHVLLWSRDAKLLLAHDPSARPADGLPEAAAMLRARLRDAIESAGWGGVSLEDERLPAGSGASRHRIGVVPVWRAGAPIAVLCVSLEVEVCEPAGASRVEGIHERREGDERHDGFEDVRLVDGPPEALVGRAFRDRAQRHDEHPDGEPEEMPAAARAVGLPSEIDDEHAEDHGDELDAAEDDLG